MSFDPGSANHDQCPHEVTCYLFSKIAEWVMANLELLLSEYADSHQNPANQAIHKICVPLIEWSLLGVLFSLPRPEVFGALNWAHVLAVFGLGYYLKFKNPRPIIASLILMAPFWIYISFRPPHLLETSLVVFVLAWIGQFYGHKLEGKKPSFFRDVFFLLIGPLWVAESLLRKFGSSLVQKK
jgi:uncharacterized membrane protein YGL010W